MTRLLLGTAAVALSAGMASAEYTLHILHTNDMHSRIESINRFDSTCDAEGEAEGKCFGGVARVKSAIDAKKAALDNQNVVVLDAGDPFQGSLFYTTYKGAAEAEFMEKIGYDAMAVGNHEFDDGPPKLAEFIDVKGWKALGNQLSRHSIKGAIKLDESADIQADETKEGEETDETSGENDNGQYKAGDTIEFNF